MKKLLLSLILLVSIISSNAQYYRNHNKNPLSLETPYQRIQMYQQPNNVRSTILPTIIGAIVGAVIVNSVSNNQYNNCDNSREIMREHYYQNQLEIERLELLERQSEFLERQHYRRERGFLGIFPKRHHRY